MNKYKNKDIFSLVVGERQEAYRQALYGVGVLRPNGPDDLTALGLKSPEALPTLVVFATEHPHLPPPCLVAQEFQGKPAILLSWMECDPAASGGIFEVAPVTYAWTIEGSAPRLLVIRKIQHDDALDMPLAESSGQEAPGQSFSFKTTEGPGVSLDPAYINRGVELFFAQYGQSPPIGIGDPIILVGIRPTVNGRPGRALGATPIKGGGVRVRLVVPIDQGLPIWGPRVADRVDIFAFKTRGGTCEWLLELE